MSSYADEERSDSEACDLPLSPFLVLRSTATVVGDTGGEVSELLASDRRMAHGRKKPCWSSSGVGAGRPVTGAGVILN